MKRLLLLMCFAMSRLAAQCQIDSPAAQQFNYAFSDTQAPSAAAAVSTLQVPGVAASQPAVVIRTCAVAVTCSVACTFTLERDGSIASTTAGTARALQRQSPTAVTTVFTASNAGAGITLAAYQVPVGGTLVLDLTKKALLSGVDNITVRTNSITGTVNINWTWIETAVR